MPKIKDYKGKTERGFKGVGLKNKEEENSGQSKIDAMADTAGSAGNLDCEKESVEKENGCVEGKICAVTAVEPKNSAEGSGKMVLWVLPTHGEPCEGATSSGGDCGYASEHYLINNEGQITAWCKTHLKKILAAYDQNKFIVTYGLGDGDN